MKRNGDVGIFTWSHQARLAPASSVNRAETLRV